MFARLDLARCVFFDLETVPAVDDFEHLSTDFQELWIEKWQTIRASRLRHLQKETGQEAWATPEQEAAAGYRQAGIFAEFGKIVCMTMGRFKHYERPHDEAPEPARQFVLHGIAATNEGDLLQEVESVLKKLGRKTGQAFDYSLVGHNIREFDVPYLCRRLLVNDICLPGLIDCAGLKPWETKHLVDTLELWKFGDNKAYTKLSLLTALFGIPSPKALMDGSQVYAYYRQGRLEEIAQYCGQDVLAVAQLILRWRSEQLLTPDEISWSIPVVA